MDVWTGRQTRDRYHRHVRRARLSVNPGAPPHRLAFTLEEALRLASLPGENEGRSYYFRRLRITGLPPGGDRQVWIESFQRALSSQAVEAVHGDHPRAGFAPAVFFRSQEEALEILLHRVLARRVAHEWFWPMVMAETAAGEFDNAARPSPLVAAIVPNILEELRACPASWLAAATALFAVPEFDVVRLLDAIPPAVAEDWIEEMDGPRPLRETAATLLPRSALPAIQQALRVFGLRDSRTLWLASLAVLWDSPSELVAATAVWRARAALQNLATEVEGAAPAISRLTGSPPDAPESAMQVPQVHSEASAVPSAPDPPGGSLPRTTPPPSASAAAAAIPAEPAPPIDESRAPQPRELASTAPTPPSEQPLPVAALSSGDSAAFPAATPVASVLPWYCSGLPTAAAGFFFLLNALERIGIAEALAAGIAWAAPGFVPRVLERLAAQAGVSSDDPIALWLASLLSDSTTKDLLAYNHSCWPSNLRLSRPAATIDDLVRAWSLAVRRWCWRNGRISLRDVVSRGGVFSVNRTDLDVSLPLDAADIRVRRVGLDLDPGWLPWFGRVVRFHYLHRGEFHG